MKVLAIETSCDETALAVLDNNQVLCHHIYSQAKLHSLYGGVVPDIASRNHTKILPLLMEKIVQKSRIDLTQLDGIAATGGPGLMGALVIGVMYAKTMAMILKKKFIAINHLEGHAMSIKASNPNITYPYLLLLISGGHSQIIAVHKFSQYEIIGNTLDDAIGESFDKVAKMLGLGYPGGPLVEKMAQYGDKSAFILPKPIIDQKKCNFSFSGLKSAVMRLIMKQPILTDKIKSDICASFQATIADILCHKLTKAIKLFNTEHSIKPTIIIAGGVAANTYIRNTLQSRLPDCTINFPPIQFCTDNAVMIGYAAIERFKLGHENNLQFSPKSKWPINEIYY